MKGEDVVNLRAQLGWAMRFDESLTDTRVQRRRAFMASGQGSLRLAKLLPGAITDK